MSGWKSWSWMNSRAAGVRRCLKARMAAVFQPRSARRQFDRYFVPGFAVLLLLLEAGGAWVLWRWSGTTTTTIKPGSAAVLALALCDLCAVAISVRAFFGDDGPAGKSPAAASGREFSAGGRLRLRAHGAGDRGGGCKISPGRFLGGARIVRAAGLDGGGESAHDPAGDLPSAGQGQDHPAALRKPCGRHPGPARKPVHHCRANARLSIWFQGFGDMVLQAVQRNIAALLLVQLRR